jgi:hypothetical protein
VSHQTQIKRRSCLIHRERKYSPKGQEGQEGILKVHALAQKEKRGKGEEEERKKI